MMRICVPVAGCYLNVVFRALVICQLIGRALISFGWAYCCG